MKVWLSIAAAALCMKIVLSCRCLPITLEQLYCNVDFVAKIEIKSDVQGNNIQLDKPYYYRINVIQVYKEIAGSSLDRQRRLYTSKHSCGITGLANGDTYLLAGTMKGGKPYVDDCYRYTSRYPLSNEEFLNIATSPPAC